jgi:predicted DNA-binding protein with PD1-like motif
MRLENGEILHEQIESFARAQKIRAATLMVIGGADTGSILVVGPENAQQRPVNPMTEVLSGVHEVVGTGILVPDGEGNPHVHIHISCGRNKSTVTGCIRKGVKVWQTMEVFIQEIFNTPARRPVDPTLGFNLLDPGEDSARRDIDVHPSAEVHPTALLEGRVMVGAYSRIGAGSVITGAVSIGHHTFIHCNVVIRGINRIGSFTHIYDNVNIEGGRPAKTGSTTAEVPDESIIGDMCWVNHGATMHGTQLADRAAMGLNACCDYDTRLGEGAVLANGAATHHGPRIPANAFADGVPARVVKENITDKDRSEYFGLVPAEWALYAGKTFEKERGA